MNSEYVLVHFATGFEEVEAITIVDVLRRAEIETLTVSVTGDLRVTGSHGIPLICDILFDQVVYENATLLVFPGGMPGSKNLKSFVPLQSKIIEHANKRKRLAAICAAPMVLGNLNLLKGRKASCYPGFENELNGAVISGAPIEEDDIYITANGVGSAIEFSLKLVENIKGLDYTKNLAKKMMFNY